MSSAFLQRPRGIRPATLAQLRGDPRRNDVFFGALRPAMFVILSLRLFISQVDNPTSLENIETKVSISPPSTHIAIHLFSTFIPPQVA